ncbi:MAG: hypothetical protein Fur0046_22950 [Cyanobacteria bacterium J069]|nr:MAG: hypothetical protein D6742_14495 [Cyanobacteria bacterium J069]
MPQSLTLFCKEHNLPKATVYRDCKQLGIETAHGLSDEAIARLKLEYGIQDQPAEQPSTAAVTVEVGNHAHRLVHVGAQSVNLEQFRTDRDRLSLAQPTQFVAEALTFLDQLEEGMDEAEAQQEQELQQLRTVKKQVGKRVDRFRHRANEYRIKTDLLAQIQSAELAEVEDLAAELNGLGKPASGDSQP